MFGIHDERAQTLVEELAEERIEQSTVLVQDPVHQKTAPGVLVDFLEFAHSIIPGFGERIVALCTHPFDEAIEHVSKPYKAQMVADVQRDVQTTACKQKQN